MPTMIRHLQGEVFYPVVKHAAAQGDKPQHLVGQVHRLSSCLQQDTNTANGRVGIIGQGFLGGTSAWKGQQTYTKRYS